MIGKTNNQVVLLGSARKNGHTAAAVSKHFPLAQVIDLLEVTIGPYTYDLAARRVDDFIFTAEKLLKFDEIIFATPVYWYAMSGQMKIFFDRLTELITTNKAMGRALEGKNCLLIACGTDENLPMGFEVPFRSTAEYFKMNFAGSIYVRTVND